MGLPDVQHPENDDALTDHLIEDFIREPPKEDAAKI